MIVCPMRRSAPPPSQICFVQLLQPVKNMMIKNLDSSQVVIAIGQLVVLDEIQAVWL